MLYFKLFRLNNWVKNLFIIFPIFFSKELFDFNKILPILISVFAFSCITSFVYILNDIFDINYDKNHPLKKNRPIASGIISKKKAILLGLFSFLLGVLILFFLSKESLFLSCFYFV